MNALEALKSNEFLLSLGTSATATGLRRCLQKSSFVKRVREALATGEVTEEGIRRFVEALQKQFQPGVPFFHEPALAALAVAMESRRTSFVEDYLLDLARLNKIAEMDVAPRVAAESLKEWMKISKVIKKSKQYETPARLGEFWHRTVRPSNCPHVGKTRGWAKITVRMADNAEA